MKLYLASFFEEENHGPGKKYAISYNKPDDFEVDGAYKFFVPSKDLMEMYRKLQLDDQIKAASYFNDEFRKQLRSFYAEVYNEMKRINDTGEDVGLMDLLPFKDGDTLLSMEPKSYTNYRYLVAEILENFGYNVVLN